MFRSLSRLLLLAGIPAASLPAQQTSGHLRDRLQDLFSFGACGKPLCLDNSVNATNGHGDHFLPDLAASNGALISFLNDAISSTASNFPLPASGSGITYKFEGGLPVRTSTSLGPIFGERAQTIGKGRFVTGANLTGIAFTSLRGVPLEGLILTFTHQDVPPAGLGQPVRENDLLQVRLDLNVNLLVSTFFATYGVSDRVDLSVAVPLVHSSLSGRSVGQFLPFGIPTSHFFAGDSSHPVLTANAATFGSATGIGDIAFRVKATLLNAEPLRLAVMADTRVPTGSEEDLTGSGHFGFRGLLIGAGQFGNFSSHLNLGYSIRSGEGLNDAVLATAGFDRADRLVGHPRGRRDLRVGNRRECPDSAEQRHLSVSGGAHGPALQHSRYPRSSDERIGGIPVPNAGRTHPDHQCAGPAPAGRVTGRV